MSFLSRKGSTIFRRMGATGGVQPIAAALAIFPIALGTALTLQAKGHSEIQGLIDSASALCCLRNDGDKPFQLEINFEIFPPDGEAVKGTYKETWLSKNEWRKEFNSPIYTSLAVSDANGELNQSEPSYEPYWISQAEFALFYTQPQLMPKDRIGNARNKRKEGKLLDCAEVKRENHASVEFCADVESRDLIAATYSDGGETFEWTDYALWDGKLIPHKLQVMNRGHVTFEAEATKLSSDVGSRESALKPPSGAGIYFHPPCEDKNIVDAKRTSSPSPIYPQASKMLGHEGREKVWAIIGRDGKLHQITILQGLTPELDEVVVETLKKWRYTPTTCGGGPVNVESEIDVNFVLH